jgi:nitroreductase
MSVSPDDILEALRWRYAVRVFDPTKTIPQDQWDALEKSLVLTPSSFGLQPWKFLVITDKLVMEQLLPLTWFQRQISDCSHLVVFLAKTEFHREDIERFVQDTANTRGQEREALEGFFNSMEKFRVRLSAEEAKRWAQRQCYIAQGQMMLAAALLGIDSCPMEGFQADKWDAFLSENFGIEGYSTTLLLPCGYRSETDKYATAAKVRYKVEEMVQRI